MISTSLRIRTELFDHGLFPGSAKQLTGSSLQMLFKNLHLVSSIDYKITLEQWIEQMTQVMPLFTENDAEIYFLTYKALLSDVEAYSAPLGPMKKSVEHKDHPEKTADVRCFAIYMAIQLFAQTSKFSSESRKQYSNTPWPSFSTSVGGMSSSIGMGAGGLSSPRSKATRIQYTNSEINIILHFVKTNLKLFLTLVSTDMHSSEIVSLNPNELNAFRVLFKAESPSVGASGGLIGGKNFTQLSSIAPFFSTGSHATKVKASVIADWILSALSNKESDDLLEMGGIAKTVTIKDGEVLSGKFLRLYGCEDSYLYIDACLGGVIISNCVNTTVMVASVEKVCTIDKCENVHISVAANLVRIGNSVDCTINCYTNIPPILYGDNRSIILGPHNVAYENLMTHIKKAKISTNTKNIHNWEHPLLKKDDEICYSLLQTKDFSKLVLPVQLKENMLMLAPSEYLEVLNIRNNIFSELQNTIKISKLSHDQEKMLHAAIQGHFREWVVNTSQLKPVTELVKMIDQDPH